MTDIQIDTDTAPNSEVDKQLGRVFRPAIHPVDFQPPGFVPHPGPETHVEDHPDMLIERNVAIPVRGGLTVYADVFRPKGAVDVPVVIGYAPFGKHPHIPLREAFAGSDIPFETLSEFTTFEQFDPLRWTGYGYAIALVDAKGNWYSEGKATFFTPEEALVGHDIVEWFADRDWSNGKIGWGGVSYYAMTAWSVAATQPPHLAAILPWDASSDCYREAYLKGGIPAMPFIHNWMILTGSGTGVVEDMEAGIRDHPTFDDYWKVRVADWAKVEVPTYTVSEFTNNLHSRGVIEAWQCISSTDKFLELRGDKEWQGFYEEESVAKQKSFFDRFLKGIENDVSSWPRVRRALRTRGTDWTFVEDDQWPPAATEYRKLWIDTDNHSLSPERSDAVSSVSYDSTDVEKAACFDFTFDTKTEITGNAKLRLWVSSDATNDLDLFVGVEKLDASGTRIPYTYSQMYDDGPLGFGWLRVSHRELDETKSTESRPVHKHETRKWLSLNEIVPVDVEIWPNSVLFEPGETLRVIVKGSAIRSYSGPFEIVFGPLNNVGNHILHSGGDFDSHLLIPVVTG